MVYLPLDTWCVGEKAIVGIRNICTDAFNTVRHELSRYHWLNLRRTHLLKQDIVQLYQRLLRLHGRVVVGWQIWYTNMQKFNTGTVSCGVMLNPTIRPKKSPAQTAKKQDRISRLQQYASHENDTP
jgi:hypothetical protein